MNLSIYYPVKPLFITQKFGEVANLAYYQANEINFIGHNGIDFVAHHGQPIYAAHDGIAYYEIDNKQGHGVVLRSKDMFDYNGSQVYFKTIYWHMCDSDKEPQFKSPIEPYVSLYGPGKEVKAGDLIGYADTTGLSTGDHLHFGLKPVVPGEPAGTWTNTDQNNGYMGAIDPAPYFNGLFAQDINGKEQPFLTDMKYGQESAEIMRLQKVLNTLGYFKGDYATRYGSITQGAVYGFQQDHVDLSLFERVFLRGSSCGPKTRAALNKLIG
jgi:murein DD-endopeptidase MepM/ murein hydrolase activator NlpD